MNKLAQSSLVLVLMTGISLAQEKPADVAGTWTGKAQGIDLVLSLKADGAAMLTMKLDGQSKVVKGKYKDGQMTLEDGEGKAKTIKYALKDGNLVCTAEGEKDVVFERSKAAEETKPGTTPGAGASDGKFVAPKLTYGEQAWDVSALDAKFKIIKCTFADERITFLLELKQNVDTLSATAYQFKFAFYDSDGVKFQTSSVGYEPLSGSKGERVRMTVSSSLDKTAQTKAVKIMAVAP